MPDIKNKIAYIIAVVNEFATRFSLNSQQAYRYLDRFKGIDFVDEFYGVEHTQSFEDVVDDLALYCHKNEWRCIEMITLYHGSKGGETYQYFFGTERSLKYLRKL